MNTFADNLRKLRKERDMTQSELAEKLFTSAQTISRWENSDGEPSLDLLTAIGDSLDVSMDRLLGKTLPEAEFFDEVVRFVAGIPDDCAADVGFSLFYRVLLGFVERYFPGYKSGQHPTFSTLHVGSLRGIYADRDDTPRMFVMMDSQWDCRSFAETEKMAEIFTALSDEAVIRALQNLNEILRDRMYDMESLMAVLDLKCEESVIKALLTLGCVKESTLTVNGENVSMYARAASADYRMLLTLTDLLCRCETDGNL